MAEEHRANPGVTLRFRSATRTGVARDLHDDAELQALRGEHLHRMGLPTRTRIIELHQAWLEGGTPLIVEFEAGTRR